MCVYLVCVNKYITRWLYLDGESPNVYILCLILREPESYMDEAATKKIRTTWEYYIGNYGKNY
ncbi:hypothetical protein DERP_005285, partial [Dermatophagoides pteronyssinus]